MAEALEGPFVRIRDDAHAERVLREVGLASEWQVDAEDQQARRHRGLLCANGALAHVYRGEFAKAAALWHQADADFRAAELWTEVASTAMHLGYAHLQQGHALLATRAYQEAKAIAEAHGAPAIRNRAWASQAAALRQMGRFEDAAAIYDALLADPAAREDEQGVVIWRLNAATNALGLKDTARAERLLDAAEASLGEHPSDREMWAWARTFRVWLCFSLRDRPAALNAADEAREVVERYGQYDVRQSWERASMLVRALPGGSPGEREEVEAEFHRRIQCEIDAGHLTRAINLVDDLVNLAEAHGDLQAQVALYKRLSTLQAASFESLLQEQERLGRLREEVAQVKAEGERNHLRAELLLATNERLADLDQQRRRLLQSTAHDLRTPLGAIKLTIELAREFPVRQLPALLDDLESAVDRMMGIVEQSLSEQAIHAGRSVDQARPVELAHGVRRVCRGFDSIVQAKGLELVVEADVPMVALVDPVGWSRIVQNLVSNAVKFGPEGGCVRVSLRRDETGRQAVLAVQDQGPGFPAEVLRAGPSWGHRGDQTPEPGSGIGLASVSELAGGFGGVLRLVDGEDGGALALVVIPVAE